MSAYAHTTIVGNLARDLEERYTPKETLFTILTVAVNSKNGDYERTDFHEVRVYGKAAEVCLKYLAKGSMVLVTGTPQVDTWKNDKGEWKSRYYIMGDKVNFLNLPHRKNQEGNQQPRQQQQQRQHSAPPQQNRQQQQYTPDEAQDDIPF